ncbi:uncharacterized protein LOC121735024 [Aricia agestis]|uniref:uncharacterized protein LOC121735024 n=1 Tax=Aricia agestis TaxID=91739 RepID=UPI001C2034C1|nr:uncharacterized protein LOC121735024 [Aricia agestis]
MTLANIFSQMGATPKQLIDRYTEYPSGLHEQHVYYEAPSHGHVTHKHHHSKGGHKSNAALSALTLLAFLFFLHILQQCLKDHMTAMSTPQVMIMTSSREGEDIGKTPNKLDKSGSTDIKRKSADKENKIDVETTTSVDEDKFLTKLTVAEYTPKSGADRYREVLDIYKQSPKGAEIKKYTRN